MQWDELFHGERPKDIGDSRLHLTAWTGCKGYAKALIALGAHVDAENNARCTPLHYAALCGHKDIAELLLCKHADPKVRNQWGDALMMLYK